MNMKIQSVLSAFLIQEDFKVKKMKEEKGIALVMVLLLVVAGMITAVFLLNRATYHNLLSLTDERLQATEYLAGNPVSDVMRQLSQNFYMDHYGTGVTRRSADFYDVGFSDIQIRPNKAEHTLFVTVRGKYGRDKHNPKNQTTMTALIKFISHMTRFGTYISAYTGTWAGGVTYDGPFWMNQSWAPGAGCVINGDCFVYGNLSGGPLTVNGDLYIGNGGTVSGATVTGTTYHFWPLGDYPAIDTNYYKYHYNYKYVNSDQITVTVAGNNYSFVDLVFNAGGTITVTKLSGTVTLTIPSIGLVIFGDNCSFRVTGTVHGRVSVIGQDLYVSNGSAGGIAYASGLWHATAADSFSAMAVNRMYLMCPTGAANMTARGAYFQGDSVNSVNTINASGNFQLYGSRNRPFLLGGAGYFGSYSFAFDPYLDLYPPPDLPEKPRLVDVTLK
jgi:hypothetical protein